MIEEKPASLPPIVMLTRVVDALRDESWLLMTSLVLAPEQAANVNDAGELAFPHRGAYALGLWPQDPLVLPAPTPEE
jgi:hypothetical protein